MTIQTKQTLDYGGFDLKKKVLLDLIVPQLWFIWYFGNLKETYKAGNAQLDGVSISNIKTKGCPKKSVTLYISVSTHFVQNFFLKESGALDMQSSKLSTTY